VTIRLDPSHDDPPHPEAPLRKKSRAISTQWLGVAPIHHLCALMFLILPTLYLIGGAFVNRAGQFHLRQYPGAVAPLDRRRLLDIDQGHPRRLGIHWRPDRLCHGPWR
jgi:hypothetical protein